MVDVDHLYGQGAALWPAIAIAPERFAAAVGARLDDEPVLAGDLYLAVGLELGDPAALGEFEATLVPRVRAALGRAGAAPDLIGELVQDLRVRVLVGDGARGPRIRDYAGRGSLIAWLKVAALRTLANQRRGAARAPWRDVGSVDAAAPAIAPDRLLLDARYGPALKDALATGLRGLTPRDQTLLRLHYVEGVALERIGALYGAHKSTVSRWLAAARAALHAHAVAAVRAVAGGVDTTELESLCASLCDRI
jgi:RNA polymerase sigma-70 factor (ECF subfamily)